MPTYYHNYSPQKKSAAWLIWLVSIIIFSGLFGGLYYITKKL